jgi:PAS domain S-box-containing protein
MAPQFLAYELANVFHFDVENEQENASFHHFINEMRGFAVFGLDVNGKVASWNPGAMHLLGYSAKDVIGRDLSCFYTMEDGRMLPQVELAIAQKLCRIQKEHWLVRQDGTRFWSVLVIMKTETNHCSDGFFVMVWDLSAAREREMADHFYKPSPLDER